MILAEMGEYLLSPSEFSFVAGLKCEAKNGSKKEELPPLPNHVLHVLFMYFDYDGEHNFLSP